ncbi:AAA family ATPase [Flectobacillus sp. DC10W]|uniref:AAA family ATPase n=1 Tax=Flectobacillus longus TaxID=2984207 RepID=A0ABT6YHF5_9BACT|nr:AAA family ATPase [Flectobacillus longus]MDI9862997.1 AAA family ATPase [Flectobacillus longus]
MKLIIKNIGAIEKAELDLTHDLIVLTGENNTGKTYLSNILYAIHRLKINVDVNFGLFGSSDIQIFENSHDNSFGKNFIAVLDISSLVTEQYSQIISTLGEIVKHWLPIIFGTKSEEFNSTQIEFEMGDIQTLANTISSQDFAGSYNYSNSFSTIHYTKSKGSFEYIFSIGTVNEKNNERLAESHLIQIQNTVLQSILYSIVNSNNQGNSASAFILPPERTAIDILLKEIRFGQGSLLFDDSFPIPTGANKNGVLNSSLNGVQLPLKDFVNTMSKLPLALNRKSEFSHLGNELEILLLGGKVDYDDTGIIKYNLTNGKTLDLNQTSSSVKSLSSLSLYLKYIAKKNDIIFFDEPEINLHPKLQIILTRFFAKLINYGFKLVISTHSDYILRELNALIMLGNQDERKHELVERYHYDLKSALNQTDIAVYSINKHILQSQPVTQSGFNIEQIDDVINAQNQVIEDIYFTLN